MYTARLAVSYFSWGCTGGRGGEGGRGDTTRSGGQRRGGAQRRTGHNVSSRGKTFARARVRPVCYENWKSSIEPVWVRGLIYDTCPILRTIFTSSALVLVTPKKTKNKKTRQTGTPDEQNQS